MEHYDPSFCLELGERLFQQARVIRNNVTMDRNLTIQRGEAVGIGLGWAKTGETAGDGVADTLAIFAFAWSSTTFSSG